MLTHFARWGNSIAVRIPTGFARELSAEAGGAARVYVEQGRLIIEPLAPRPEYSLDELLEGMSPSDSYPETETGFAVGNERV